MIVRIKFEGIIFAGKKKQVLADFVDIHSASPTSAKVVFLNWVDMGAGVKGNSGVFHPLKGDGEIKLLNVAERSEKANA